MLPNPHGHLRLRRHHPILRCQSRRPRRLPHLPLKYFSVPDRPRHPLYHLRSPQSPPPLHHPPPCPPYFYPVQPYFPVSAWAVAHDPVSSFPPLSAPPALQSSVAGPGPSSPYSELQP